MIGAAATSTTMLSIKDADPFDFYERLRARGPIVRDEVMNAWLVVDYEHCRDIETNEAKFANPYAKDVINDDLYVRG